MRLEGRIICGKYLTISDGVVLDAGFCIATYPKYGGKDNPIKTNGKGIIIGENTRINRRFTAYCADSITIGKDCLFGANVLVTDNNHGFNPDSELPYYKQPLMTKETMIGDGCWICQNVSILAGSQIGKKCIIAAGSIVNSKIPDYSMAAGSPAKVIKKFNFETKKWERV